MHFPAGSYIVMQAYGSEDILNECVFALLTLSRHHTREELQQLSVCIYTDRPEYFRSFKDCWLKLSFKEVNAEILKRWKGDIDFVHRVKIEVLRDFSVAHVGQILYLDTDICFAESSSVLFEEISHEKLYMHIMEGPVHYSDNVVFQKLSKFLKSRSISVKGNPVPIPDNVAMWNAGVLGFHTRYAPLLDEVLAFTDEIHRQYPRHVVEQFAFSLYFQQTTSVLSAHTAIFHYWNLKELRPILHSFFHQFRAYSWEELIHYGRLIQLPDYLQQKANFYYNRSTLDKLLKKKWRPVLPDWEVLKQQL